MLEHTFKLKKRIIESATIEDKLDVLKNAYAGETCYLLTAGPSINVFWNKHVEIFLADKLVVAVKQTYNLAADITDFHLLNSWNYQVYNYHQPEPIILTERGPRDPETVGMKYDLLFHVQDSGIMEKRLAVTRRFDDYLFDKNPNRPWGPGIMYELGIYLAVHLGVSELITFGWDLGKLNSPTMPHYFDVEGAPTEIPAGLSRKAQEQKLYNKPLIHPEEVEVIKDSTKDMYYWLREKGIDLKIVSDRSLIDSCVPRLNIETYIESKCKTQAPLKVKTMTVIIVSFIVPLPDTQGNHRVILSLLRWLRHKGYRVIFVLQVEQISQNRRNKLKAIVDELIVIGDNSIKNVRPVRTSWPETIMKIHQLIEKHHPIAIIAEYLYMSRCFENIPQNILTLIHTHDMLSRVSKEIGEHGIDTEGRELTRQEEREALLRGNVIIALQHHEAKLFKELVPEREVIVVSYASEHIVPEPSKAVVPNSILMVGSQNPLNQQGLKLFITQAWTTILKTVPNAQLRIIGRIGEGLPEGTPSTEALGIVENLRIEYARASIVINPVFLGTGLKIKMVEALSYSKAIVSTPTGIEGMPIGKYPPCLVANNWPEFAESVIKLLTDGKLRRNLERKAIKFASMNFTENSVYAELQKTLTRHASIHRLRVVVCAFNSNSGYSGGRYHAWMMAEALVSLGYDVVVWTNNMPLFMDDFSGLPSHESIMIHRSPDFSNLPDGPFDIVILVPDMTDNYFFYFNTFLLARKNQARLIFLNFETPNWFNQYSPELRDPSLWKYWLKTAGTADIILSLTKEGTHFAKDYYKNRISASLFRHVYPSINTSVADKVESTSREHQVICITRYTSGNKHKGGWEIFKAIGPAMTGCTLAIVIGTGMIAPNFEEALLKRADRFGVNIRFLYKLTDYEKFTEIKRSTLMLFLSYFEGFGYPPVEAQYCDTPCIVYDLPVLREVSGEGLIYVPPGDEAALQDEISKVLSGNYQPPFNLSEHIAPVVRFDSLAERLEKIMKELAQMPNKPAVLRTSAYWHWQLIQLQIGKGWTKFLSILSRIRPSLSQGILNILKIPSRFMPFYDLAYSFEEKLDFSKAIFFFKQELKTTDIPERKASSLYHIALSNFLIKQDKEAEEFAKECLKLAPRHKIATAILEWLRNRSELNTDRYCLVLKKFKNESFPLIRVLKNSVNLKDAHGFSFYNLGCFFEENFEFDRAVFLFKQELRTTRNPDRVRSVLYHIALLNFLTKQDKEAEEFAKRCLRITPGHKIANSVLEWCQKRPDNTDRYCLLLNHFKDESFPLINTLKNSVELKNIHGLFFYNLACFFEENFNFPRAIFLFKQELAVTQNPERSTSALYHIALLNFLTKQDKEASEFAQRCLEAAPNHKIASAVLEWCEQEIEPDRDRYCLFLDRFKNESFPLIRVLKSSEDLKNVHGLSFYNLGCFFEENFNFPRAIFLFKQELSVTKNPERSASVLYHIALLNYLLEQDKEAEEFARKCLEITPNHKVASAVLEWCNEVNKTTHEGRYHILLNQFKNESFPLIKVLRNSAIAENFDLQIES